MLKPMDQMTENQAATPTAMPAEMEKPPDDRGPGARARCKARGPPTCDPSVVLRRPAPGNYPRSLHSTKNRR